MIMYWGNNFGLAGFIWMLFWMLTWTGFLSLVLWAIMRASMRRHWQPVRHEWHVQSGELSALEIIDRRYALGELDAASYEEMREHILAHAHEKKALVTINHR
jgi:putative membrane protein